MIAFQIGEVDYHLATNNCEHFAQFCRYGEMKQEKVHHILTTDDVNGFIINLWRNRLFISATL